MKNTEKRSSWPLHVEIFCSNYCPSGSSLRDVILPTSMLIMNFRNRTGEDPKEVTANLFRLFTLVPTALDDGTRPTKNYFNFFYLICSKINSREKLKLVR